MRKMGRVIALGALLTVAMSAPALAATGISVDGMEYVFYGDQSVYTADGKTFQLSGDSVTIKEAGKPDRVLPMQTTADTTIAINEPATEHWVSQSSDTASIAMEGAVSRAEDTVNTSANATSVQSETVSDPVVKFAPFTGFGLRYDSLNKVLYYQNQKVRVFEDSYPLGDYGWATTDHFDPSGTVDVRAERDLSANQVNADGSFNPGGTITGLRALSNEEFAARDLSPWTSPSTQGVTAVAEGKLMTAAEKQAFYAPYAPYGVVYDAQTDRLTYEGNSVRRFLDVRQTNGESFSSGKFNGSMTSLYNEGGQVDITVLRDYANPDANGDGKIYGIHADTAQ